MIIETFISPYLDACCYLLREDRHVVIVDPCDTEELRRAVNVFKVDFSLITHEHWDHISGIPFVRECGARVLCGPSCEDGLGNPKINGSRYAIQLATMMPEYTSQELLDVPEMVYSADQVMKDKEKLVWLEHVFEFRYTPGHSPGSCCILLDDEIMFSGDLLFVDRPTQYRWPGGDKKQLSASIDWAMSLNPNLQIYPGHFRPFTLSDCFEYKKRIGEKR